MSETNKANAEGGPADRVPLTEADARKTAEDCLEPFEWVSPPGLARRRSIEMIVAALLRIDREAR